MKIKQISNKPFKWLQDAKTFGYCAPKQALPLSPKSTFKTKEYTTVKKSNRLFNEIISVYFIPSARIPITLPVK